jgi:hypothetical protein
MAADLRKPVPEPPVWNAIQAPFVNQFARQSRWSVNFHGLAIFP